MKITIRGNPKEIVDTVFAIQGQRQRDPISAVISAKQLIDQKLTCSSDNATLEQMFSDCPIAHEFRADAVKRPATQD